MANTDNRKVISIGMEDFKEIIDKNGYFVDKTMLIKELLASNAKVILFTRPRRFGKTLTQSMLRRFFEDERKSDGTPVDNRYLFEQLAIQKCGDTYLQHQQQYPVIKMSLKSAKQPDFNLAYTMLKREIVSEFSRHSYVLGENCLTKEEKERYRACLRDDGRDNLYADALKFLSECLKKYHGKKTIILIDEYDVPLENAYFRGFYDEMTDFIRSLFESALKTNDALEFSVITGCLRISKESIFTGLNNLQIDSVLHTGYGETFGFTEAEVKKMLSYYELENTFAEVKDWYDGYLFGGREIYNPWSILNYVHDHIKAISRYPRTYWSNTSSNSIVRNLIRNADKKTRDEIELLISGKPIKKTVHEDITYADIYSSQDNLWNFLYFTGYLKAVSEEFFCNQVYLNLKIPNLELQTIYQTNVQEWFRDSIAASDLWPLQKAMEEEDCDAIGDFISDKLMGTISYFDYDENYYHGSMTGLLNGMSGYDVLSNRESGEGRPDLILKTPRIRKGRAIILELKNADSFNDMERKCKEALQQMEQKKYEADLRREGYENILKYGICFYKKECIVLKAE